MFDEIAKIKEGIVNITPGTTIVCYTDGLVELENDNAEDFGMDSLKDIIKNNPGLDMKSLNKLIMETIITYKQSRPYIDDIALFSVHIY
jgi:sigma-B regulation protein RsbU (phosphoserine phosphatase)